ncbi:hypothetical protein Brms1b_009162 [Colletotrichum noveboracense]|nr:hypothetical protein COL940_012328 [Colletotrichum noveboracense]KAJ0281901.1 hypothetical protein CBS470a_008062 [Colletotrichum nupharicola]KAJ0309372.1 hypothetical protein Brms1b_009162 [Colletotrichum noveboracense]
MSHFETEYDKILRELAIRCDQAWGLYAQDKLDEALDLAENILQEEPGLPATHKAVLHVLLSKSQDITKAVEHAQKAVNRYRWIIQDSKGAFTSSDHSKFFNKKNLRNAEEDLQTLMTLRRVRMDSLQDKQADPDGSQDDTSQEDDDSKEDSDSQEENGSQEDIDLANRVLMRLRAPPRSPKPTGPTVKTESSTPS